ncbi:hypothetical protein HMPREF0061_1257 [Aerococcus viridans ATCC 11563 = CCUG 4311]|uniref:Uncharacterized protein n=1 Tax=Aerococcus viridans (strain ATCC 11563 / DSM 20340 / CCUG 4311 / JCM 20461 / NBRC 12219 / NCTC 8251 / M1) TaxID=655812 RepID=A0ABP2I6Y0_AERVM|nr:hypothetical protein HMPREF0061_1257 [Aerococcus viridans ATCC 11563 = CCUG 4311]
MGIILFKFLNQINRPKVVKKDSLLTTSLTINIWHIGIKKGDKHGKSN